MNRSKFTKIIIRYILFGILAVIAVLAGGKVVTGTDCSSCPGKGICKGETDCSSYLTE